MEFFVILFKTWFCIENRMFSFESHDSQCNTHGFQWKVIICRSKKWLLKKRHYFFMKINDVLKNHEKLQHVLRLFDSGRLNLKQGTVDLERETVNCIGINEKSFKINRNEWELHEKNVWYIIKTNGNQWKSKIWGRLIYKYPVLISNSPHF